MSSAYSAPINYGESIPLQSIQTIGMVQTAMQQKYDANLAKVDEIVSQFSSIDLLRGEDKKYLGERLQTLLSTVDNAKGLNWTDSNTVRMLSSHISKAVDPYIVQQVGITRQVKDYMQTAAKKKEKNPDLYSDENYSYGLEKAGYSKYMAGETNTLGELEYTDYHDPQKNLIEPLEKWAKDLGYEKSVDIETGEYSFKKEKKETLSKERINDYIDMRLEADPKLKKQMTINAWKEFSGVSDDTFKENYINVLAENKEKTDKVLLETQASLLKYPKDSQEHQNASQLVTTYQEQSANLKKQMDNPDKYYSRENAEYTSYTSGLKRQIADTYAKESVLDIDYDWIPKDVRDAENERKLGAQKKLGVTTEIEITPPAEIDAPNYAEKNKAALNSQYAVVKQTANKLLENDKNYQSLPEDKKTEFINNIIKQGGKVHFGSDMDAGLINEVSKYRQLAIKRNDDIKDTVAKFDVDVKNVYNKLLEDSLEGSGSGIKWDNLVQTLPQTVRAVRAGKTYEELTAKEKALVKADIITNKKNTTQNSIEKSYYNTYLDNLKKENPNVFVTKKKILNQPEQYKPANTGKAANAVDRWFMDTGNTIEEGIFNIGQNVKNWVKGAVNTTLYQDENLAEIGVWDVSGTDGFKSSIASLEKTINDRNAREAETVKKRTQITFNSEIKEEKRIVDVIQSAAKSQLGSAIPNSNFATVSLDLDKQMAYLKVDAKEQQTSLSGKGFATKFDERYVEIPFSTLPADVINAFDLNKADFTFSVKNPQKYEKTFVHKISNTQDENFKKISTVLEKYNLPDEVAVKLLTDPKSEGITTKEDYYDDYAGKLNTADIDRVVSSNYEVQLFKKTNVGFFYNILENGKIVGNPIIYTDPSTGIPFQSIDESKFLLQTPSIIDEHIRKTLDKYATR